MGVRTGLAKGFTYLSSRLQPRGRLDTSDGPPFFILGGGVLPLGSFDPATVYLSSVAGPPIGWIAKSIIRARLQVDGPNSAGTAALQSILDRPAKTWSQASMVHWITTSLLAGGTTYLHIQRDGPAGMPTGLDFVDPMSVNETSYKRIKPGGEVVPVQLIGDQSPYARNGERPQLVRLRYGVNPTDPALGTSPLASCLSEMVVDKTAADFERTILKNLGIAGAFMRPGKADQWNKPRDFGDRYWKQMVEAYKASTTGRKAGGLFVSKHRVELDTLTPNFQGLNPTEFRNVSEERVCAAVGISPTIVGFGAGLQQTKVGAATEELRREAWQNGVMPWMRIIADALNHYMIPEFYNTRTEASIKWDTSGIPEMEEDRSRKFRELREMTELGWPIDDAAEYLGLDLPPHPRGSEGALPLGRWDANEGP